MIFQIGDVVGPRGQQVLMTVVCVHGPDEGPHWSNQVECLHGTERLVLPAAVLERRDAPVVRQAVDNLRERLVKLGRELAAEQWYSSPSYESSVDDQIAEAVSNCKADIGKALLVALGEVLS